MVFVSASRRALVCASLGFLLFPVAAAARGQDSFHRRGYKPPPPPAHIVVTVVKAFDGRPLENAAVIFHAVKNGKDTGNLEIKTDPDGRAVMDLIDAGSHVTVQVIATGFATYADAFDVTTAPKEVTAKLLRPRAQLSDFENTDGEASQTQPGIQSHQPGGLAAAASKSAAPASDSGETVPVTPLAPAAAASASPAAASSDGSDGSGESGESDGSPR